MTTLKWKRRVEAGSKKHPARPVYDVAIHAGRRFFSGTVQGYTRLTTLERVWKRIEEDIKAGRVKHDYKGLHVKGTAKAARAKARALARKAARSIAILALLLLPAVCSAVNSPRPASVSAIDGSITITWTNLSGSHPWLLSYADAVGQWRWETNRLASTDGRLTVSRPMTQPIRLYRLWPANP